MERINQNCLIHIDQAVFCLLGIFFVIAQATKEIDGLGIIYIT